MAIDGNGFGNLQEGAVLLKSKLARIDNVLLCHVVSLKDSTLDSTPTADVEMVSRESVLSSPESIPEVEFFFVQRPAAGATQGRGSHHRHAVVHLLLESGSDRPQRPRFICVLCRRHRRAGDRKKRSVVHPRCHAVQLRRALRLHGKLQHVRARRRLRRRSRRDGPVHGPAFRFRTDLRLHPDRARSARSAPASTWATC